MLCLFGTDSYAQSADSAADNIMNFPTRLLNRIQSRSANLDRQLTRQTEKYLQRLAKREQRLREKIARIDSNAAKSLFSNSGDVYAALAQKLRTDSGGQSISIGNEYQPYTDSLRGTLAFLEQNPRLLRGYGSQLSPALQARLQGSVSQLQSLQAKLQDADQIKDFIQQRKQVIKQFIEQHNDLQNLLGKDYAGINKEVYYYSQQVRQYREMLDNPDELTRKALALLDQLPAFQQFMKNNSQLGSLFALPGNYGSPQGLAGLQTRDLVAQLVQQQVGGGGGTAALQANLQSAESQLDNYKSKLSQLGDGNGDMDMPAFKPNDQRTRTFWRRLEYGTNFQTTHNNYYFPTVSDFGLSVGYRLGHSNVVGVGASYKLGWGNGIRHIALSSQGAGLRSFIDIHVKGSFSATGGLEFNYTTPFTSIQQISRIERWTQSGLLGVAKTVSKKSTIFQKTQLQLLWDFLSYQQVPKTQPIIFRIGYVWR